MTNASTLKEVIDDFAERGWAKQFAVGDGSAVRCFSCGAESDPARVEVAARRRLEGASDPSDMATVYAVRCPECEATGTVVVRYGPEASAEEAEAARGLRERPDVGDQPGSSDPPPATPSDVGSIDPEAPGASLFTDGDAVEPNEPA